MTEKTIKSYQEPGVRLQLVRIELENKMYYQIRRNRCVLNVTNELKFAIPYFRSKVYQEMNQTSLEI